MPITKDNLTFTENGAVAYASTGDECLNLFARIGGLRDARDDEIVNMYLKARAEDKELADSMVLYARNIRDGGIGERRIGRLLLKTLALKDAPKVARNLDTIVSTGRWDDLWALEGSAVETDALAFMKAQFRKDVVAMTNGKTISLLAKWLPSANTSSKETRRKARKVYTYFGISERVYRKTLSALRAYSNVVEVKMSANEFDAIEYSAVPSVAMTNYRSAFGRHDFQRFDKYLKAVDSGKAKINASVTYPYELIRPYTSRIDWSGKLRVSAPDPVLEAQWKALPNYVEGEQDVIVMSDVSGSMEGHPMDVSISLGLYFAERNQGPYKDMFMTFTDVPQLYCLDPEDSVLDRAKEVLQHVGYNTNLNGAFEAVYREAKKVGVAPKALVVISDGEIDNFLSRLDRNGTCVDDIIDVWDKKYKAIGLRAPKVIMWNVASRGQKYLGRKGCTGVSFVSGSSASSFKELTNLIDNDAVTAMLKILSKPQFQWK